ncbi:GAF domain-containing protein [uncultured Martelella sp.]|uniref:GAF domain-containing protein n=1 Tax=uncultured Martelella sp. TaxID=392331 RepID=UPI0029C653AC|nr:GAF domain-containing protein [uncultured Martelella sp.]
MTSPDYSAFTAAVADGPEAACKALEALTKELVGVKLFTLMTADTNARNSERIYSNMPEAYPVSGTKPYNDTYWSDVALKRRETFVANTIEGIAEVFDDHRLINELGCQSVINVPVTVGGEVIGTINCLHETGFYTQERIEAAEALKLPGAICMLLHERGKGERT